MTLGPLRLPAGPGPGVPGGPEGVRRAAASDAAALHRLSERFVRSGALRRRPPELYAARAGEFLVVDGPEGGAPVGCVALRTYREGVRRTDAVLYNFCVLADCQGTGVGSRLLTAALLEAAARSAAEVFTATTGGAELFLRCGFREVPAERAPQEWARALDPTRGSRVYARRPPALPH
ncbi:GNAT family N-acetyltransferase [Peterkaempfera bronchialis]|uniref:GNAT family N-acetyltransferase n=1 Tax=Peterkaempfera bronchialis TaxID=2126346 RepID=UPI0022467C73|nr:GNAT family N-acetyltransferase [Peterkaempfera bronchialis]